MKVSHARRTKLFALIFFAIVLLCASIVLPIKDWMQSLGDWVQTLGPLGPVAFAIAYIVAVLLVLPTWILTVSAGVAFGFWGIPLVIVSASAGATLAFLIARIAFRERVRSWAQQKPLLKALDNVTKNEGWKVVGLLRLSPVVPFTLQNYAFGATEIPVWQFVIATFFGIMPGTALYVYIGTIGRVAAENENFRASQILLLTIGLIATVAVIVIITRKAKSMLDQLGMQSK